MGCVPDIRSCASDERPQHQVTLDAFYMDIYEVTVDQYAECVQAGRCSSPASDLAHCNWGRSDRGDHPVNCVSWSQANSFCEWAGKRLPTEAEWEYAARGDRKRKKFPWGDREAACDYAVMNDGKTSGSAGSVKAGCGEDRTWPVGSKPNGRNKYGLYDMAGNVWEWTADWYGNYPSDNVINPRGPSSGTARVLRGGSWYDTAALLRAANRDSLNPQSSTDLIGFRCSLDYK